MQNIQIGYVMLIHVEKFLSLDYQSLECARSKRFMGKDIFVIEVSRII